MATLQIKKKSDKIWEHIDSELGTFIVSKFYFNADFGQFQIVEQGQSKRRRYDVADIEVFDIGGLAETFVNITQLSLRLEELNYVGLSYEVVNITGVEEAPIDGTTYGRKDADWVAVFATDVTADHEKGNWNASTNSPTLTNGVGQIGDHYKVSVAGTQFSISWSVGDIIAYDGSVWYKFANNNQVVSTKKIQEFHTLGNRYTNMGLDVFYSSTVESGLVNDNNSNIGLALDSDFATASSIRWVTPVLFARTVQKLKFLRIRVTDSNFTSLRVVVFIGQSVNGGASRINNQIILDTNITVGGTITSFYDFTTFTNDVTIPVGYDLCYMISRKNGASAGLVNGLQLSGYTEEL